MKCYLRITISSNWFSNPGTVWMAFEVWLRKENNIVNIIKRTSNRQKKYILYLCLCSFRIKQYSRTGQTSTNLPEADRENKNISTGATLDHKSWKSGQTNSSILSSSVINDWLRMFAQEKWTTVFRVFTIPSKNSSWGSLICWHQPQKVKKILNLTNHTKVSLLFNQP